MCFRQAYLDNEQTTLDVSRRAEEKFVKMEVNQAAAEARKQKIRNLEFSLFGEKQNDVSFFFTNFQLLQY